MQRRRLLWHLYPSYFLITLISVVAIVIYASNTLQQFFVERTARDIEARAHLIGRQYLSLTATDSLAVDPLCEKLGNLSLDRITVWGKNGELICDSKQDGAEDLSVTVNPEVVEAISAGGGHRVRFSEDFGEDMLHVAVPIKTGSELHAVLRASMTTSSIGQTHQPILIQIFIGGVVVALLAAAASWFASRRVARMLDKLRRGAERFAAGDLEHKLEVPNSLEIGGLAESLNRMAADLFDRIQTVIRQRNEQQAVLSSMVEGVLAVDLEERIFILNKAASNLIGVDLDFAQGRTLQEVARNVNLHRFVAGVIGDRQPAEEEIVLHGDPEMYLQVHGTVLRDAHGHGFGVLVVINDVTRLRKLENVRRDFVANVSHELKTPITSIKGFVETLEDGALEDPEAARRFLAIISRQADRLSNIIEDLLSLSRIEQGAEESSISLAPADVRKVIKGALIACEHKAKEKNIRIKFEVENEITAEINPPLLEQAVVNLIDNAIKFSESNTQVDIDLVEKDGEVVIGVEDRGCGIESENLSRLFERFYRIDKARSRSMGGTGLGLAIVKHICQAHNGYADVESQPGIGSCFSIHIPKK
jgi:two-component system phosphate regulon sensor histidine kinase PhoR